MYLEGLRGWRFDARAFPVRGARPQTPDADRFLASVDLEEGRAREPRADEASLFEVARGLPGKPTAYSGAGGGSEAWAEALDTLLLSGARVVRRECVWMLR